MTADFLSRMASKVSGKASAIEPRLPSLFEPDQPQPAEPGYLQGANVAAEVANPPAPFTRQTAADAKWHEPSTRGKGEPHHPAPEREAPRDVFGPTTNLAQLDGEPRPSRDTPPPVAKNPPQIGSNAGLSLPHRTPPGHAVSSAVGEQARPSGSDINLHSIQSPVLQVRDAALSSKRTDIGPKAEFTQGEPNNPLQAPSAETAAWAKRGHPAFAAPPSATRWRPPSEAPAPRFEPTPEPAVSVTIGRVEVRASLGPTATTPAPTKRGAAPLSLDAYLQNKARGK